MKAICFEEKDRARLERNGKYIIEVKRSLYNFGKTLDKVFSIVKDIYKNIPKEEYKRILGEYEERNRAKWKFRNFV